MANRTAESPQLLDALRARAVRGPCEFTLLVPATPQGVAWAADMFAGQIELYEMLGATDKRLHAYPGQHSDDGAEALESSAAFLDRYLK